MRVNFEIGSRVFGHEAIAADITEEVILGMDVIKSYGFNLDLKKDVLRIDNEEIPFSDTVNDVLKVHICEHGTLPSFSETVVMARHDGNMEEVSTYMMEPCVDSPLGKGLAVGETLVKMRKNVPVRISNVNSFPVTLKRDTVITESRPVCALIGTVTSPARSSRNKCPQQLLNLLIMTLKLDAEGRTVYQLVTKEYSHQKPCYEDLRSALLDLKEHLVKQGVKKLAISKLVPEADPVTAGRMTQRQTGDEKDLKVSARITKKSV
ncbi:hypothetical protein HHI36_024064 [Cryptolaemus montrouzieri]|uniref:Uncharacterized protein n=1 Tax=Cryptolaemus montrouzieri TaxID=559131 RepID=A0ABD2NC13_9CUCU